MKRETYSFIYKAFAGSKIRFRKILFLILISIVGALFEIGFLSIINMILNPSYDREIFTNLFFILIIFLSIFFGFFKIYIMHFCGNIVNFLSLSIYRDSFLFSLNKSLFNWSSDESSFITKTTISSYRITNNIIVPITFAIPPLIVSIFLSIYLIYKYPLLVLIGVLSITLYYFTIIKVISPILKFRSKIIQSQDKRMKSLLSFSFRDRLNLFLNGSFQNILKKYDEANREVRKAEAETIIFNNTPKAMLEVAIYIIVILAYYLLVFNNQKSDATNIMPGELATILICFLRLSSIANQIYGVVASVGSNNSQLEELINSQKIFNSLKEQEKESKIDISNKSRLLIQGRSDYFKIPFYIKDEIIISPGEITTIEGDSGIGKSTFCQLLMLSNLKNKIHEDFQFNLQSKFTLDNKHQFLGSLFCLNAQNLLVDGITAFEFLESVNPLKANQISNVLLDLFNKKMVMSIINKKKKLTELSGGEFQRILIARTILSNSKFVFLDETTSGLDNINELKSIKLLKEKNIGILIISHKGIAKKYAKNRYMLLKLEEEIDVVKL